MLSIFTVTVEWEDLREGQWLENLQVAARDRADAEALARAWLDTNHGLVSEVRISNVVDRHVGYPVPASSRGVIGHLVVDEATGSTSWEPSSKGAKQARRKA